MSNLESQWEQVTMYLISPEDGEDIKEYPSFIKETEDKDVLNYSDPRIELNRWFTRSEGVIEDQFTLRDRLNRNLEEVLPDYSSRNYVCTRHKKQWRNYWKVLNFIQTTPNPKLLWFGYFRLIDRYYGNEPGNYLYRRMFKPLLVEFRKRGISYLMKGYWTNYWLWCRYKTNQINLM